VEEGEGGIGGRRGGREEGRERRRNCMKGERSVRM
jgi:hypothetical protein